MLEHNPPSEDDEENFIFKNEDLSIEPQMDRFDLHELLVAHHGQDIIWDSGASNNVTGDRYALHNLKRLDKPIAVQVATDGPCDYITGTSTLIFSGTNSTTIAVKKVFYCKNAQSTLLSVSAFKKSDAKFWVLGNFDTIDLLSSTGKLLLLSNFDSKTNMWPLPCPLRAPPHCFLPSHDCCNTSIEAPIEMNTVFKSPHGIKSSQLTWNPEDMTADEKQLLFWHRLFGHASLRQIRRLVKMKLGYGLPSNMPVRTIKCPVCSICKATRVSTLHHEKTIVT
jgi:hypothetical protein